MSSNSPQKVMIIAEAGVNHNGDIDLAKKLVDVAAEAGVDYVKFQTFKAEKLVSHSAAKADYQIKNTGNQTESQLDMLKNLELSKEDHHKLIAYCKSKNIEFFSTAFDDDSLDFLNELGLPLFKVPSGEITNLPYLQKMAGFGKPVILSTGMSTLQEVEDAFEVLIEAGLKKTDITILHCNTEYPTPMEDVNLNAMNTMQQYFGVNVGYSDHTPGIEVAIVAVAKGAVCIEKHFTLDKNMEGPDHAASREPEELKNMVTAIRNIEKALGDGVKKPSQSEKKNIQIARKSIFTSRDLPKGHVLKKSDLITMRPGDGISPMKMSEVIGKMITEDMKMYEKLSKNKININGDSRI
ncbi:MAG: N-acetylneuraminate synthase [Saprospiraceae bacterium]|nr:N-acetylneuraminate synthase [Saprospiraceae bacterium]